MTDQTRRGTLLFTAMAAMMLAGGLTACEDKGPVQQAAEEIDEGVDTLKRGGDESTASKVDDAIDEAREGAKDAAAELKK